MNSGKPDRASRRKTGRSLAIAVAIVLAASVDHRENVVSVLGLAASAFDIGAHAAEASPWIQLKGEKPALSLDQTAFSGQQTDHHAYEHTNGSRSDWATSGSVAVAQPNLVVMIVRRVQPQAVRSSVVKDMEYFGELKHFPQRYRPAYYALTTRFGELRGIAFDVNADGIQKYCFGFHTPGTSKLFVRGSFCSKDAAQSLAKNVACLVDRIRYVNPAVEEAIKANLAPADVKDCDATALDGKNDGAAEKLAKDVL
jgi:hypothetical protein